MEINTAKQDVQMPAQEILIDATYETDEEEFGGGGGNDDQHTGHRDDDGVMGATQVGREEKDDRIQSVQYETDEEEFTRQPRPEMKTSEERSHVMYSLTSEACKTTTTNKHYSKKMPTVRKKTQDYNIVYFSLWWSRMVREGKKEEEEGLSNERMRRMSSLMLARRSENDCDDVPLSESGREEMAENGCASMISTDVQIVPVEMTTYDTAVIILQ